MEGLNITWEFENEKGSVRVSKSEKFDFPVLTLSAIAGLKAKRSFTFNKAAVRQLKLQGEETVVKFGHSNDDSTIFIQSALLADLPFTIDNIPLGTYQLQKNNKFSHAKRFNIIIKRLGLDETVENNFKLVPVATGSTVFKLVLLADNSESVISSGAVNVEAVAPVAQEIEVVAETVAPVQVQEVDVIAVVTKEEAKEQEQFDYIEEFSPAPAQTIEPVVVAPTEPVLTPIAPEPTIDDVVSEVPAQAFPTQDSKFSLDEDNAPAQGSTTVDDEDWGV